MTENEIATVVLDCAFKVHKELGPGLLEGGYELCLFYELAKTGLLVERQKPIPLIYDNVNMGTGYHADLIIENKVLVELKSVEALKHIHLAQVITYLKLSNYKLGLLINFNTELLKYGIKRVANGM